MTPKEKAKELVDKYATYVVMWTGGSEVEKQNCKQCALIAVDEIINSSPSLPILGDSGSYGEDIELSKIYWIEVKQEIEKL
jgi:hypothetical protein